MTKLVAIYRVSPVTNNKGVVTGNFSAYDATGTRQNRVHIPKALAESFALDSKTAMPIYAIVSEETYNVLDESNQPVKGADGEPQTFVQKRAGNLFTTEEAAIKAQKSNVVLEAKANAYVSQLAAELKLTPEVVASLAEAI